MTSLLLEQPPEVTSAVDSPSQKVYQTIVLQIEDGRRLVHLTFAQYMQLPELHAGSNIANAADSLMRKLVTMGLVEPVVECSPNNYTTPSGTPHPGGRQPGQHEIVENPDGSFAMIDEKGVDPSVHSAEVARLLGRKLPHPKKPGKKKKRK